MRYVRMRVVASRAGRTVLVRTGMLIHTEITTFNDSNARSRDPTILRSRPSRQTLICPLSNHIQKHATPPAAVHGRNSSPHMHIVEKNSSHGLNTGQRRNAIPPKQPSNVD